MNRFNVFITVLVCAGLCVLFGALSRSTEDATGWNPSEMYTSTLTGGSSFTNAAYSGSSNSGVALPMPSASFSSRVGAHAPYTYSASPAAGVSQLPSGGSSAVVGHMTSSAEYHSFGGGGNVATGSSSMARRSSSVNASPISYNALSVGSISLPTAPRSSSANNAGYTPSLAQEANYAIASSNMQGGLFDYALQTTYGTASYEAVYGNSSPNRVNNRFNAPPGMSGEEDDDEGNAYLSWLEWMSKYGSIFGNQLEGEKAWEFGDDESWSAFLAWYLATYNEPYDESGVVTPKATYAQWVSWFKTNGSSHYHNGYSFYYTPIDDTLPLLLMVLVYIGCMYFRRKKISFNSNVNK